MAVLTREQNGIVFNNINNDDGILKMPLKISQTSTAATYKLLDAVNIDWNGAELGVSYEESEAGTYKLVDGAYVAIADDEEYTGIKYAKSVEHTINETGDLLKLISDIKTAAPVFKDVWDVYDE